MEDKPTSFNITTNKERLYSDMLVVTLRKLLPSEFWWLLDDLQKASFARWTAVDEGDEERADKLKDQEDAIVNRIVTLAKNGAD
ncbi:MAG: hypothetical protein K2Z81_26600 [Cyanobacteria bacterium]|nr:hypothetical protein [Cyanobacteriota bacterium]